MDVVHDGNPVLRDVSLTVEAGEHGALPGAIGVGKCTLLPSPGNN